MSDQRHVASQHVMESFVVFRKLYAHFLSGLAKPCGWVFCRGPPFSVILKGNQTENNSIVRGVPKKCTHTHISDLSVYHQFKRVSNSITSKHVMGSESKLGASERTFGLRFVSFPSAQPRNWPPQASMYTPQRCRPRSPRAQRFESPAR